MKRQFPRGGLVGPNLGGEDDEPLAWADPTRKGSVGTPQKSEWCKRNADQGNVKGTLSKTEIIIDGSFSVQLPQSRMITASRRGSIRYLSKYI
jgi:hypothetical protein